MQRDLDAENLFDAVGRDMLVLTFDVNHFRVQRIIGAVEEFDELQQAVLVTELVGLIGPFVKDADHDARVEERQLLKPLVKCVVDELGLREDLRIGRERDLRAGRVALADLLHVVNDIAASELHRPNMSLATDFDFQPLTECVDGGNADSVQTTRSGFVAADSIEFSSGVNLREDDLERGLATLFGHASGRDASAVVDDGNTAVGIDLHRDRRRELVDRFVDAVIDDLVDQVMQATSGCVADVHGRPMADALDPFEGLDLRFVVGIRC